MRQLRIGRTALLLAALAPLAGVSASVPAAAQEYRLFPGFNLSRALANYEALQRGTKQLADLNGIELREVRALQQEIRATHADRNVSREQCIAEQTRARGGHLSDLAARIVDLACSQR